MKAYIRIIGQVQNGANKRRLYSVGAFISGLVSHWPLFTVCGVVPLKRSRVFVYDYLLGDRDR